MTGSASRFARRRLSLLASSSLVAASLMAGLGGAAVVAIAPTAAFAANECGDPSANGAGLDNLTCTGANPAGITYTTDGSLYLQMEDGVSTTGGISVTGGLNDIVSIATTSAAAGAGDPSITNPGGTAIKVDSAGALFVLVDLGDGDLTDGPTEISGLRGISILNPGGVAGVVVREGSVAATAGNAIDVNADGGVTVNLFNTGVTATNGNGVVVKSTGDVTVQSNHSITADYSGVSVSTQGNIAITTGAVTGTGGYGVRALSNGGTVDVTTNGAISGRIGIFTNATGNNATVIIANGSVTGTAGPAIYANTGQGDLSVALLGAVNATGADGVAANSVTGDVFVGLQGATVTATGGAGVGVKVKTGGAGTATVSGVGTISGDNGVLVQTTGSGLAKVDIAGDVNGTNGNGVTVLSNAGGSKISVGAVTATGAGIVATSNGGDASVLSGSVTAGSGFGVQATTSGAGNASVVVNGSVSGTVGIVAQATGTGTVTVIKAGGLGLTATNGDGVRAIGGSGLVTVTTVGSINATGGIGVTAGTLAGGDVQVTVNGFIAGTATSGILAGQLQGGGITILANGNIGSAADGVSSYGVLGINSGAQGSTISVTANGAVYSDQFGVGGYNAGVSGAVSVIYGGPTLKAGADGVIGFNANAANADNVSVAVTSPATITAAQVGVQSITAGSGNALATLANGVTIDPNDYGVQVSSALGDATAALGDDNTIVITNTDGDATAVGVEVTSGRAADAAINDAAAEVHAGTNLSVTIDDGAGGEADGAVGVAAKATGAAGSALVQVGDGLKINITGNGATGVLAQAINGYAKVTTGAGSTISVVGLDGVDTAGTFPGSAGIRVISAANGAVVEDFGASIVVNNGALPAAGVYAQSGGAGVVLVQTLSTITSSDVGILTQAADGVSQINIVGDITAANTGVRATSTTGDIDVQATRVVTGTAGRGMELTSGSGSIAVRGFRAINGGDTGILATTGGAGGVAIFAHANVTGTNTAGIVGNGGLGGVQIIVDNNATVSSTSGSGIINNSAANGLVGVDVGSTVTGASNAWVVDVINGAAGSTTINNRGLIRSNDATTGGYDDLAIRGAGGSVILNNDGRLNGRVDFSGLAGNVVFNNTSSLSWHTTGASVFSPGADLLSNTGLIATNAGGVATSWDFLGGADRFVNSGTLVVGEPSLAASTLTISNLETWNNSGRVVFGSSNNVASDNAANDRILAPGTTFNGTGNSRLVMDANLGAISQTSCATLAAADCLSLTGGSTSGSTLILLNDTNASPGAYNPAGIVLVDVSGAGTSAAGHFALDPNSEFWRADANSADGVLDKGLFFYDLTYDAANKKHLLVGLPDGEAFEFATIGTAAQGAWYNSTGVWFERQADLRNQLGDTDGGAGVWLRLAGANAQRDLTNSYTAFGTTYSFDTGYEQRTASITGGVDFRGAAGSGVWVVGGTLGYVDTDTDFDRSRTVSSLEGMTYGIYGSYVTPKYFIDAILSVNDLDLEHQAPSVGPAGSNIFTGGVQSIGGQVEGGWKIALGQHGSLEPLASLAYVRTTIDDLTVAGTVLSYDDQTSFRGSLGARVALDSDMGGFTAKWSLTARVWQEWEGENQMALASGGPGLVLTDDFSGTFGDVAAGVNLFSNDSGFSSFANVGVKFKDDYQEGRAQIGFRWNW